MCLPILEQKRDHYCACAVALTVREGAARVQLLETSTRGVVLASASTSLPVNHGSIDAHPGDHNLMREHFDGFGMLSVLT